MQSLAARLALAFGNVPSMSALYAKEIIWTLPRAFGEIAGPYRGRDAVIAFNRYIDELYEARTVKVTILDDVDAGDVSAARFIYRANMLPAGGWWEDEYVLFVRSREGLIEEVHERLDSLGVARVRGMV